MTLCSTVHVYQRGWMQDGQSSNTKSFVTSQSVCFYTKILATKTKKTIITAKFIAEKETKTLLQNPKLVNSVLCWCLWYNDVWLSKTLLDNILSTRTLLDLLRPHFNRPSFFWPACGSHPAPSERASEQPTGFESGHRASSSSVARRGHICSWCALTGAICLHESA